MDETSTLQEAYLNKFNFFAILAIFIFIIAFQLILLEAPCLLCLLQRIGFLSTGLGFLMNLRFGNRPSHFLISLLSALFTNFVALQQIHLHRVPGTDSFGGVVFGLHLYTWSFVISLIAIVTTAFILGVDRKFETAAEKPQFKGMHFLCSFMIVFVLLNIISVFLTCGLANCPDFSVLYYFWY